MEIKDVPEILKLSTPEKIIFLEDLWDSIASNDQEIPIPDSHKEELDNRFQKHSDSLGNLLSLSELQSKIEAKK